jgi:hypothetical protein
MVGMHGTSGLIMGRLSTSRLRLARQIGGTCKIVHRWNFTLSRDPAASVLLGRHEEGPQTP